MRLPFHFASLAGLALLGWNMRAAQLPGNSATDSTNSTRPAWDIKAGPSAPKTPVDYFRALLALPENEREQALASKPESQRIQIQGKLREYETMPPEERESRLRAAQLHWYFEPLVTMPPGTRVTHLAAIPVADRRIIEQRLKQWDKLPDDMKKQVLERQRAQQSVLALGTNAPATTKFAPLSNPDQKPRHERDVSLWNQQSTQQRSKMVGQFGRFFEQPAEEKEKTLKVLSNAERLQMEKTLRAFEKLPPSQRQHCIDAFRKFDLLPKEERDQFLKTAERWQTISRRTCYLAQAGAANAATATR